jgi:hypothetical protein
MLNSFSNGGATDISTLTPRIKYGTRVLSDTSLVLDVGLKIGTCSSIRKKTVTPPQPQRHIQVHFIITTDVYGDR